MAQGFWKFIVGKSLTSLFCMMRPLSLHTSEMLAMQNNLLEKSTAELLRTDLLHMHLSFRTC